MTKLFTLTTLIAITGLFLLGCSFPTGDFIQFNAANANLSVASSASGSQPSISVITTCSPEGKRCDLIIDVVAGVDATTIKLDVTSTDHIALQEGAFTKLEANGDVCTLEPHLQLMPLQHSKIVIPISMNPQQEIVSSGEYIVQVRAHQVVAGQVGDPFTVVKTKVYVDVDSDGAVALLPNANTFNNRFVTPFANGLLSNLSYQIVLADGEYPQSGTLYVRVVGLENAYAPTIRVGAHGVIQFDNNELTVDAMLQDGSRIVAFPFSITNMTPLTDTPIQVTLDNGDGQTQSELIPLRVALVGNGVPTLKVVQSDAIITPETSFIPTQAPADTISLAKVEPDEKKAPPAVETFIEWTPSFTGVSGSIESVFADYVETQFSMGFQPFVTTVRAYNPHLVADGGLFYPDKLYWMPTITP